MADETPTTPAPSGAASVGDAHEKEAVQFDEMTALAKGEATPSESLASGRLNVEVRAYNQGSENIQLPGSAKQGVREREETGARVNEEGLEIKETKVAGGVVVGEQQTSSHGKQLSA